MNTKEMKSGSVPFVVSPKKKQEIDVYRMTGKLELEYGNLYFNNELIEGSIPHRFLGKVIEISIVRLKG